MPYVSLDDDELIEMILERPHLISKAVEKLQESHAERDEELSNIYNRYFKLRDELIDLKKEVDSKQT